MSSSSSSSSSPPSNPLVGPPVIRQIAATAAKDEPKKSFTNLIDKLLNPSPRSNLNSFNPSLNFYSSLTQVPLKGCTENNSSTYLSSGNPCLDFFFQVVPDTPSAKVSAILSSAWKHDPLTALKLVCNLRGVRGTGKSDREGFYASVLWLHDNHPKTVALNVASFAEFGYMKDLLEILYRLIYGADVRKSAKAEMNQAKRQPICANQRAYMGRSKMARAPNRKPKPDSKKSKPKPADLELEKRNLDLSQEPEKKVQPDNQKRMHANARLAHRAVDFYTKNHKYRFLYESISEFFAGLLSSDLEQMKLGKLNRVGLAAKWCPSLDSSFDKATLLCESIARHLWPKDSYAEYKDLEEVHYAYRVRARLRREVLVPLRMALELPEVYMSACQWGSLPYNRVASVAMKKYSKLFKLHNETRFDEYLEDVKEGKAKIAAGALLPHEVVASALNSETADVAELQWKRMVQDLIEKGKLRNCIAVCDVSGSMCGTPMDVCVALGMLISELSKEPWKGRVITFSARPQIHIIKGKTLKEKMAFVKRMDWGMKTDLQKVFDQLLEVAVEGKLVKEKMIKRIFVFSDMEFDQASANTWETDYEVICRKYQGNGYGSCIPEIVFWNLRDSRSTPVPSRRKGVALVSGFSKNLMKIFLEKDGEFTPESIMQDAISGKEYQKLQVFD